MGKIVVGADHGGFELKNSIKKYLEGKGYSVTDIGTNSKDSVDYPDIARSACEEYKKGGYEFGIVFCGTGIGISIAANKVKGIRCAVVHDLFTAEMTKKHNNANFLSFGERITYQVSVEDMIDKFIATDYEGGRHDLRLQKISIIEEENKGK